MKIFCIGIGGIGLSGVAQILKSQGHEVTGSDSSSSAITQSLIESGIRVFSGHAEGNLKPQTDLVIYSEAVPESNPERMEAGRLGIRAINYAHALGMVTEGKQLVAITGTHGKTTITGILTCILLEAKTDPSIIIGSRINVLGDQNYRIGKSELFLAEACEYRDNFLTLTPNIMLINSLEPDHLDYFKTTEQYYASYQKLADKIPESGALIVYESDIEHLDRSRIKCRITLLNAEEANAAQFQLQVPGRHNQRNAFASRAVAKTLRVSDEVINAGLEKFHGTWRRFEYKGSINGAKVYDDYGHHPTEIRATIQAAREWYLEQKLLVIFQPHQYSRTREFFDEFTTCFKGADEVWITDIYKARDTEEDIASTSAEKLTAAINEHQPAHYFRTEDIHEKLKKSTDANTIVLVMGAGNINRIFEQLKFDVQP